MASNHLEDRNTQSPQVNSLIVSSSNEDLRSHEEVGSDDCEHVSPLPSKEGPLGDAEVNEFDLFLFFVKQYILRLYIPMADISGVKVLKGSKKLPNNGPQLFLIFSLVLLQAGNREVFHHQVGSSLLFDDIESFIFAYRRVIELFQQNEVPLHGEDVLLL